MAGEFLDETFTVRFGGPLTTIDLYTLTDTLAGLARALDAVGEIIDPEVELELILESLSPGGSLLARIKSKKFQKALLGGTVAFSGAVFSQVLATYISDLVHPHQKSHISITADGVVIDNEDEHIEISKDAFAHLDEVHSSKEAALGVKKAFTAVARDESVQSLDILPEDRDSRPAVSVTRTDFAKALANIDARLSQSAPMMTFTEELLSERKDMRRQVQRTELHVLKAVFERGDRKWQFYWNGRKISAVIVDHSFFDRLEAREIALHQGDALDVDLESTEKQVDGQPAWETLLFRVTRVYGVVPGPTQTRFEIRGQ